MLLRHTPFGVAALLVAAVPLSAQLPAGARAIGMGGAYVAAARGHEALFLNPANLGLDATPYWSVGLPQVGFSSTTLGVPLGDLPELANYDDLDPQRKEEILASIPASGTELRFDAKLPLASMSNRRLALGVMYGMTGQHSVGKDLVELLANGYQEGRTDYSVGRSEGSRATYLDLAAGYGRKLGPVSVGVAGHYYRGLTLMRSKLFEPRFDLAARDFEMRYVGVHSRGGHGYGVDVGAALQPSRSLTVSAVVSNALSRMTWSQALRSRTAVLTRAHLGDPDALLAFRTRYEGSEGELDASSASLEAMTTAQGLYQGAYFPATLRAGAAWKPSRGTDLGIAYESKLTEGGLGGRWDRTASLGFQQKVYVAHVRGGYATNLSDGQVLSAGLSLGPVQLGVAKITDGSFDGAERRGYVATFGLTASSNLISGGAP